MQNWEKWILMAVIGIIVFIGFVSLFYSWIDSAFGINANVYMLTGMAAIVAAAVVYVVNYYEEE
jgi:hypothetical protein